jgi:choline dehydrogenase-like flavoprotein
MAAGEVGNPPRADGDGPVPPLAAPPAGPAAEQAPDPDSRVLLGTDTDVLGMPRARLDWRLGDLDVRSAAGLVDALGRETRRLGLGEVEPAPWLARPGEGWRTDALVSTHPIGGYHHMGTTRMADDPSRGVVDADGRVHGIDNLFVAGSSVFPTGGWANPTLTIIALAMRTADRLVARRAGRPSAAAVRGEAPARHATRIGGAIAPA